jgi:hypothetical protein
MRVLLIALAVLLSALPARADTLAEIAAFAQSICGEIPVGSYSRTTIQGRVAANAGVIARIVSGDANLSAGKIEEIYNGIPFDKLPSNIPTVAMCKSELAKAILSRPRTQAPPPQIDQYVVCSGEYERACRGGHDTYYYCYTNLQAIYAAKCESVRIVRLNTYGGNKCGYSIDRVYCTNPR